jgi:hypothetical protein
VVGLAAGALGVSEGWVEAAKVTTTLGVGAAVGATTVDPGGAGVTAIAAGLQIIDSDPTSPFAWLKADQPFHGFG